ncbi:MAG: response regulator [Tolypothrix carrinoi HA7290-LM1]|nr:response regulator [Tolypothrix carrinoi HA7290-LM1]
MSNNFCDSHTQESTSLKTPQVDFSSLGNLRILVVDDNIDCLYLVKVIFEDYQAQVKTVTSVDQAIEAIEESKPDVLISDICMQGKDGYSLIRSIRRKEAKIGGFLPALALTGYAHPQVRAKAFEAGFQELIFKPFDPDKLVAEVAKLTRLRYSCINKQTFLLNSVSVMETYKKVSINTKQIVNCQCIN